MPPEPPRRPSLVALAAAAVGLCCVGLAWVERSALGFPDGHLTERDAAYEILLAVYCGVGGAWSAALGGLGLSRRAEARRWVGPAVVGFVLLTAGFVAYSVVGLAGLEHGQGG